METLKPNIPTHNKFGILAECLMNDVEHTNDNKADNKNTETQTHSSITTNQSKVKLPPIYIHKNYPKLPETTRSPENKIQ
ncbi:hypothetical protein K0M31_006782 [Melipona bicolor]|uniref:Uncharacterized protein n=1 Tax=Melipona bicolor TaxID=60889 RepID=A0AA40FSV5_9HYME|nr:hypothetical protein K0M31_006782 [Melipona bicolor]